MLPAEDQRVRPCFRWGLTGYPQLKGSFGALRFGPSFIAQPGCVGFLWLPGKFPLTKRLKPT